MAEFAPHRKAEAAMVHSSRRHDFRSYGRNKDLHFLPFIMSQHPPAIPIILLTFITMFWFLASLVLSGAALVLLLSLTLASTSLVLNRDQSPSTMNHQDLRTQILANAVFLKPSSDTTSLSKNHYEIVIARSLACPPGYIGPKHTNAEYEALTAHVVYRGQGGTSIFISGRLVRGTDSKGCFGVEPVTTMDALGDLYKLTKDMLEKRVKDVLVE